MAPPEHPERRVLRLRKLKADEAAGASLNFPFGVQGEPTTRLLPRRGWQGARICLTDHYTWPCYAEDGRFGISYLRLLSTAEQTDRAGLVVDWANLSVEP